MAKRHETRIHLQQHIYLKPWILYPHITSFPTPPVRWKASVPGSAGPRPGSSRRPSSPDRWGSGPRSGSLSQTLLTLKRRGRPLPATTHHISSSSNGLQSLQPKPMDLLQRLLRTPPIGRRGSFATFRYDLTLIVSCWSFFDILFAFLDSMIRVFLLGVSEMRDFCWFAPCWGSLGKRRN